METVDIQVEEAQVPEAVLTTQLQAEDHILVTTAVEQMELQHHQQQHHQQQHQVVQLQQNNQQQLIIR